MLRRAFLAAPLAAQLPVTPGLCSMSYNILACLGFPKTAANEERFSRLAQQQPARMAQELLLYRPDLVNFSESVTRQTAETIARAMHMNHVWFPPGVPSFNGYPIGFPGTILTRFQITESQDSPGNSDPELYTRHWGRAVIHTGAEEIVVHSAHLNPHKSELRLREIDGILAVMEKDMKSGRSILLQGDLNHGPEAPEYERWVKAGLT